MLRILLADDHSMIRRGLRVALEENNDWQICGEASTGREAVNLALKLKPNVAILDLTMPELSGLEATRKIRKALPDTEVLIYTMHESEALVREVFSAGARGYLLKSDADLQIVSAVQALSQHKPFIMGRVSETILEVFLKSSGPQEDDVPVIGQLTAREREIVQLLAEGRTNKAVATLLGISVNTVETHRTEIMRKLGVRSIADLVRYAVRNKLIQV